MAPFNCYKLTTQERTTQGVTWAVGEWHTASGLGSLCSASFLHAYPSALCAIFMNAIHANIQLPRLWKAEALGASREDAGLKVGFAQLRIVEEILPPIVDQEHRIRLALMASLQICANHQWIAYAENYLDGNRLTFRDAGVAVKIESEEERSCRTYAWKAAMYEDVERNAALAVQTAAQYKPINTEELFALAWGGVYLDTPAAGTTREHTAFRSAPHD